MTRRAHLCHKLFGRRIGRARMADGSALHATSIRPLQIDPSRMWSGYNDAILADLH
jgi:hypothetical protein